jgi:hypothetical protein
MSDVILIRWPDERVDAERLAGRSVAILYLVNAEDDPPVPTTCLEDWVRIPGDDRDLPARLAALELRATLHRAPPSVDEEGRFHYRGRVLVLPDRERPLARLLVAGFGALVTDDTLASAIADKRLRRATMTDLRHRLRVADLLIRRVPRRGYILDGR